jgi:hypothetical protein
MYRSSLYLSIYWFIINNSSCTTSSKPVSSVLVTWVQFPNGFSDPLNDSMFLCIPYSPLNDPDSIFLSVYCTVIRGNHELILSYLIVWYRRTYGDTLRYRTYGLGCVWRWSVLWYTRLDSVVSQHSTPVLSDPLVIYFSATHHSKLFIMNRESGS